MYRPPDIDNVRDFFNYYHNQWIGIPKKNSTDILPFQVRDVQGEQHIVGNLIVSPVGTIVPHIETFKELLGTAQFGMPQVGMVNYGPSVAWRLRGAPRRAMRGMHTPGAAHFHIFHQWPLRTIRFDINSIIWSCFNSTYTPLRTAGEAVEGGSRLGDAIGFDWAIVSSPISSIPDLYFQTDKVGQVNKDEHTLILDENWEHLKPLALTLVNKPENYGWRISV